MVVKGEIAKKILFFLLQTFEGEGRYELFPILGYFKEGRIYICFDNSSFSCFVEQAKTKKMAKKWCCREIDASDLYI